MTTHHLKTWPIYWDAVCAGYKTFEVRKNDRFFQAGDLVELHRWNPDLVPASYEEPEGYTSARPQEEGTLRFRVGPVLQGGQFGIEPGYCVFSLLEAAGG